MSITIIKDIKLVTLYFTNVQPVQFSFVCFSSVSLEALWKRISQEKEAKEKRDEVIFVRKSGISYFVSATQCLTA